MAFSTRFANGSIHCAQRWAPVALWFVALSGCDVQIPAPPAAGNPAPAAAKQEPPGCTVRGRIVSTAWRGRGGRIERAIVTAWALPESRQVAEYSEAGERFEVRLPPGKYRIVYSAVGTRGATFEIQTREITIGDGEDHLDVGQIDLPISKSTRLYGQPAPELGGIVAWRDTPPLALKDLRGKVVVLDFFGYYCTICHAHKPDLVKLRDQFKDQGLVVLAIHDASLKTLEEMNAKMEPVLREVFNGNAPRLPIALDGTGDKNVFNAYGIYAVPAVILIDQQGRIVRRYHHAGKPDLEADVRTLLTPASKSLLEKVR